MTSLRRSLLEWLLPLILIASVSGTLGGNVFLQRRLETAFDHDLGDVARTIAPYLRNEGGRLRLDVNPQAEAVLRADSEDQVYYAVRDAEGRLLAGDTHVPRSPGAGPLPIFWDAYRLNQPIRAVALHVDVQGVPATIVAAETTRKRELAARDALLSSVVPMVLLVIATVLAILLGVRRGLAPVAEMRAALERRSSEDLRPLDASRAAAELQPMVRALNDLLARLEEARRTQARFIANAAHQLRTPIAGLVTQIDLARDGPDASSHLDQARLATARLARLAQQVLSLAAADPTSNPQGIDVACDLSDVVRDNAAAWLRACPGVEIEFALERAPVRGIALLLGEAASNLVDNAARYGARTILVSTAVRGDRALLRVEDDGPGIPPADRERVMERFQRGRQDGPEGSGLGLAIVKEIAQRHGGGVAISEAAPPLNGTCVTLSFPCHA